MDPVHVVDATSQVSGTVWTSRNRLDGFDATTDQKVGGSTANVGCAIPADFRAIAAIDGYLDEDVVIPTPIAVSALGAAPAAPE